MQPAVFLDRDNTLIDNDGDLGRPELVRLREGVPDALRSLRAAGFRLVVVTNQGGVARGAFTEADVDRVHQRIAELIDGEVGVVGLIDRFYYCPFHPEGAVPEYKREHSWRKPQPGMIIQAARDLSISLDKSWVVGDQARDIQAGKKAGCRTILLSRETEVIEQAKATAVAGTMSDAVAIILDRQRRAEAESVPNSSTNGARRSEDHAGAARPAAAAVIPATKDVSRTLPTTRTTSAETAIEPHALPSAHETPAGETEPLRRAVLELAEEIRAERMHRLEFTPLRMAAGVAQLLVILLVLMAIFFTPSEAFDRWMQGAILLQLAAIALLMMDRRG